jgi:Ca2+-binding RTX toxin-like protein
MTKRILISAAAALALAAPGAAQAATAGITVGDSDDLIYAADPGERNQVTVSAEGDRIVFEDAGADITPGQACTALSARRVICESRFFVVVQLEDGDDQATAAGPAPDRLLDLAGGSGADTLRAEQWQGFLDGGVGADVLVGGPQTQQIDGTDSYAAGSFDFLPRRDPVRDEITCAAPPEGGSGATAMVDDRDAVSGPCGATATFGDRFVDVRGTAAADQLSGTRGPARIHGLAGDDNIQPERGDRAYGEAGDDTITGGGSISGGAGDDTVAVRNGLRDTVRCGAGRDSVRADRRDRVARDCEVRSIRATTPPEGSSPPARRCRSTAKGSRVVQRAGSRVVYRRPGGVFGCATKRGRERELPDEGGGIDTGRPRQAPLRIAGRYVGYVTRGSAIGDEFDRLYVYDLVAGRAVLIESGDAIGTLVLKANGSVAWTDISTVRPVDFETRVYEVRQVSVVDKLGSVLLERGTGVAPRSLRRSGDQISWRSGGSERTAPLR